MMEVIGSTELGAAALQRQRPWVVMSALGMVGADGHPSAAGYTPTTYDYLCFGLSFYLTVTVCLSVCLSFLLERRHPYRVFSPHSHEDAREKSDGR